MNIDQLIEDENKDLGCKDPRYLEDIQKLKDALKAGKKIPSISELARFFEVTYNINVGWSTIKKHLQGSRNGN